MIVKDIGPTDARIMIVGDAPDEIDSRNGIPFCGPDGSMLKQMLTHSGIDFNSCYVTNVVDTVPPNNEFKYFYGTKQLDDAIAKLKSKIESIKPDVVILLGSEPLTAVCNKYKISEWRGTWLSYKGINIMPTYDPSYVLKQYEDHVIVELDFKKAWSQKPESNPPVIIRPSLQQILDWIDYASRTSKRIAFDIETIGKHIRCISFASKNTRSICIPFIKFASSNLVSIGDSVVRMSADSTVAGSYWSNEDEVKVLDVIDSFFNSGIQFVGHNSITFDAPRLEEEFGLTIKNHYLDTMHAFHCCFSELQKGLDFLCSIFTNYSNYWTEKDTKNDDSEWFYNCMDSIVTLDCSYIIEDELEENIEIMKG